MDRFRLYLERGWEGVSDGVLRTATGVVYTYCKEDACEYVTVEKAAAVARELTKLHGVQIHVEVSKNG